MKIITTQKFMDFLLRDYDDTFDEWYCNFLPCLKSQKTLPGGKVEVNLDENIWNDKHEHNVFSWFRFVVKDDCDPYGRLMDTYSERTIGEKNRIRAFIKEGDRLLTTI